MFRFNHRWYDQHYQSWHPLPGCPCPALGSVVWVVFAEGIASWHYRRRHQAAPVNHLDNGIRQNRSLLIDQQGTFLDTDTEFPDQLVDTQCGIKTSSNWNEYDQKDISIADRELAVVRPSRLIVRRYTVTARQSFEEDRQLRTGHPIAAGPSGVTVTNRSNPPPLQWPPPFFISIKMTLVMPLGVFPFLIFFCFPRQLIYQTKIG